MEIQIHLFWKVYGIPSLGHMERRKSRIEAVECVFRTYVSGQREITLLAYNVYEAWIALETVYQHDGFINGLHIVTPALLYQI